MNLKVCNRNELFDGKINIDIPYTYKPMELPEELNFERKENIFLWSRENDSLLLVEKIEQLNKSLDEIVFIIKQYLSKSFNTTENLGVFKRNSRGFEQMMTEDKYFSEKKNIHCIVAVLRNDRLNIIIYQIMNMDDLKYNKEIFSRIIDSIYEIRD